MSKVSVIIPVYNVEQYLPKCLDSIINQTLKDIEIICVNDCSTDRSLSILHEYASKDKRIKLIDLPQNKGAGCARNIGIDNAKGEYIGFVDSDDYVDLDFYEKLYKKAEETKAEIIKGADLKIINTDGSISTEEQNKLIKRDKINFIHGYTTAIYKSGLIKDNNICFPSLLIGEDPVFTIKTAFLSKSIEIVNDAQYYYEKRENSLNSDIWNKDKLDAYCKHIEMITDFVLSQNLPTDKHKNFFGNLLQNIVHTMENQQISAKQSREILEDLYKLILSKTFRYPIKILFDACIFTAISDIKNKRGIYYCAYNIIKKLIQDDRFEVTLWMERNIIADPIKQDELLKNLKIAYSNFVIYNKNGFKLIPNPLFNPYEYDAYINTAHLWQLTTGKRPAVFNVLYDVMPLLCRGFYPPGFDKVFYDFYIKLTSDVNCFCISQSCKDGFTEYFDNLDKNKMLVTYIASANDFKPQKDKSKLKRVLEKYNVNYKDNKYIFYFGAVNDVRKNITFSVECFIHFIKKYNIKDLYFYLGGSGKEELIKRIQKRLGSLYDEYKDYIVFLGFVDDEDVNILYSNSLFFSFLSLYEGFGMPLLEAMQTGTPVICSNNSSIPEVVGNAALIVDIDNEDDVIEAYHKFYTDEQLRNEYIKKGFEQAKKFSWDKTYQLISERIIEVVSGK